MTSRDIRGTRDCGILYQRGLSRCSDRCVFWGQVEVIKTVGVVKENISSCLHGLGDGQVVILNIVYKYLEGER
jgi:hypothetical protein